MTGDAQFAAEPTDPVKPSRKSLVLSWLVPFVLFLGACGWAAAQVDWSQVMRQLREASFPFVSAMGLAWIAALFLRPLRMMVLIGAMAPKTARRYWPIWSADMIAMAANSVIPMRAGDMMIAFLLRQSLNAPEGVVSVDPDTQHTWRPVYIAKMRADGQFDIVWTSDKPVRPVPYPISRSKTEWEAFLQGLYTRWGNSWANPHRKVNPVSPG